ncbi:MAG TPA: glycosyltransferase family 9 protein [Candidatus Acidoferrales bacterium]|nr:glycosyltransferase family 9 protein [Candidatus Acidoferrales bacterium]
MPNGLSKSLERTAKGGARRLLASLASWHHQRWHGFGKAEDIKRIIVIRQHNQFGDVLCTVPLLRALKTKFCLDELAVVVSPQNIDAVRGCRYVDKIINYDKLAFYRKPSLFFKFFKELRNGYDVLLVPSNVSMSLTNDIMSFFIKAKVKIGPKSLEDKPNKTHGVYDIAVDLQWDNGITHQSCRNMQVAIPLGIDPVKQDKGLEYDVDERLSGEVSELMKSVKNGTSLKVAIHAGAGKAANRWNVWNFAKLSELLHDELGADLYFTEGSFDHEIVEHLTNLIKIPFVRVRNRTIQSIAALLTQMDLTITNDTGIMHLSAAVGTSTLSLFGPTDPLQWAPAGSNHRFILGRNSDINSIEVNKVFDLAKKMALKN